MGFYGNITNTARTQFQFDRIYANRYEMVKNQTTDGIYAGRYVLVEYDSDTHLDTFLQVSVTGTNMYYTPTGANQRTLLTYENLAGHTITYTINTDGSYTFYQITDIPEVATNNKVSFIEITKGTDNYTINYNIDVKEYGAGRGYDSTVWQKMYVDNVEKYVMIAELNTVVPTFDVIADAPTMSPLIPHFDTQSTDVYYKLHWQSPWGFRVANGEIAKDGIVTTDKVTNYKSDEKTSYTKVDYKSKTDEITSKTVEYPAAIYYNKAGFDEAKRTYEEEITDKIQALPTGISGNGYNKHDGTINTEAKEDIIELSMMLPTIGNAICTVWDKLYGVERYRDIDWKLVDESENEELGGMTRDVSTLAGCINSVHDLMGMIVTDKQPSAGLDQEYDKHYIYQVKNADSEGNISYSYEYIVKENNTTTRNEYDEQLPAHQNSDEYNYYYKTLEGLGNDLNTIFGCILEIRSILGQNTETNYDRDTVYGSVNVLNEIIDLFDILAPEKFVIYNNNRKIKTADWTSSQEFAWENLGIVDINNSNKSGEEETAENQFITVAINGDKNEITFSHMAHTVEDTDTLSDMNGNGDYSIFRGINDKSVNELQLYTPIVDNMGHVIGKNIETVILPYGFKTIKVSNTDDTQVSAPASDTKGTQVADNTQDTLTFAASNRWIKVDNATEDTLKVGHKLSAFKEGAANTYYGISENGETISSLDTDNTFEVPRFMFDEAGHILAASTKTVTLPENFTKVSTKTSADTSNSTGGAVGTVEADTLTDELSFIEGNQWVNLVPNADNDSITISHYVKKFDETTNTVDFNSGNKTFDIQGIGWDNAGHLVKSVKTTYTLPNNMKQISIQNSGNSIDNNIATASNGNLIAATPIDTMTIDTGNRWIQLEANPDNKKVSIYHNIAGQQIGTSQTGNETPKFGKTFFIPEIRYDNLGHITSTATHTVAIPEPSLNKDLIATTSSVITGLSLDVTEGKLTQTNNNVGSLALTGYGSETDAAAIDAEDTINGAIRKLENQISNEVKNRADSVSSLTDTVTNNYNSLNNAIETEVTNRNEAIAAAVNALDVDEISANNSYISSIKQVDGKISANITALPDYSSYWDRIATLEETVEQLTADLGTANNTITALQKNLADLLTTVEWLSAKVDGYHPVEEDNAVEE